MQALGTVAELYQRFHMTTFNAPSHADDMQQVSAAVTDAHDPELIHIACTQLVCEHLLKQYELQHGNPASLMLATLARMVDAYAQDQGYSSFDLMDAQAAIHRANATMAYLSAIPSDADIAAAGIKEIVVA